MKNSRAFSRTACRVGRTVLSLAALPFNPREPANGGEDGFYTLGRYLSRLQLLTSYRYREHSLILYSPSFVSATLAGISHPPRHAHCSTLRPVSRFAFPCWQKFSRISVNELYAYTYIANFIGLRVYSGARVSIFGSQGKLL